MNTSRHPRVSFVPVSTRLFRVTAVSALLCVAGSNAMAQNRPDDGTRRRGDGGTDRGGGERGGGDRGNFNPQEMQARMLASLRERFEVTDDEEWKLISERIAKVSEARRNAAPAGFAGGGFTGRGGPQGGTSGGTGGGGADRGGRGGTRPGGSPEMTALTSAVRDKLPDAELKSRLERVREIRKDNEAKLSKAQEDLRAVLSVRQEAVAVVYGLLP
jgi:hypothetical protein